MLFSLNTSEQHRPLLWICTNRVTLNMFLSQICLSADIWNLICLLKQIFRHHLPTHSFTATSSVSLLFYELNLAPIQNILSSWGHFKSTILVAPYIKSSVSDSVSIWYFHCPIQTIVHPSSDISLIARIFIWPSMVQESWLGTQDSRLLRTAFAAKNWSF